MNPRTHQGKRWSIPEISGGAMHYEIERKFLVRDAGWRVSAGQGKLIRQGYLARDASVSLRVRIIDRACATLTLKSAVAEMRRLEFEYDIPLADGVVLLGLRESGLIEKLRYTFPWHGLVWEIDVFQGENQGLVIAEIELPHEDKVFEKPEWLGSEVTSERRYSNASLAKLPFQRWPAPSEHEHVRWAEAETGGDMPALAGGHPPVSAVDTTPAA
jgi:adenylate cyclase